MNINTTEQTQPILNTIKEEINILEKITMFYNYATLDENNFVIGVSELAGEVPNAEELNMILIEKYDVTLLGKFWNGNEFISQ